jgi:redox-sensitive bicupin YhaK (pirin superfamily)
MREELSPTRELLEPREVYLCPRNQVRRLLPHRHRRMVGAWCFVDHYGGDGIDAGPMGIPSHPHSGLQTVSWLLNGEIRHRDSQGHDAQVLPGELNLMTAGPGIAHSEYSMSHGGLPHGLQLWVALPDEARDTAAPTFSQHADLPVVAGNGFEARVICGEFAGARSDASTFTPLVGADLRLAGSSDATVELRSDFEYAVHVLSDEVIVDDEPVSFGQMMYVGGNRTSLSFHTPTEGNGRVIVLGGTPFDEEIVMWWNFIGRTHDEIGEMRATWNGSEGGGRFGVVPGGDDPRLLAPPLPNTKLKHRGRVGRP